MSADLRETGLELCPLAWRAQKDREARIKEQSELVADVLFRHDFNPYRPDGGNVEIGLISGRMERSSADYRNLHAIPIVAARNRSGLLLELMAFLSEYKHAGFARYSVLTGGQRVKARDIPAAKRKLNSKINDWIRYYLKPLGIETLLKTWEFPYNAETGDFHLHCNLLYAPTSYIPKAEWSDFLSESRLFFGTHWADCGKLENPHELIKYVLKPEEMISLAENDPQQMLELVQGMYKSRLVEAQGAFQQWRRSLKDEGMKVVPRRKRINGEVRRFIEIVPKIEVVRRDYEPDYSTPGENVILAYLPPKAKFMNRFEPTILVNNVNLQTLFENPRLHFERLNAQRWWAENTGGLPVEDALRQADEARRALFNVHNNTITSETEQYETGIIRRSKGRTNERGDAPGQDRGGFDGVGGPEREVQHADAEIFDGFGSDYDQNFDIDGGPFGGSAFDGGDGWLGQDNQDTTWAGLDESQAHLSGEPLEPWNAKGQIAQAA